MKIINLENSYNNNEIITLINKVFHDVESEYYENTHPEIYEYELLQWKKMFSEILADYQKINSNPISILDVGTGVGFVPSAIGPLLHNSDTIIFSDISKKMLEKARELTDSGQYQKRFMQINGLYSDVSDQSIDFVTMNSVLHHIADIKTLFSEIDRVLKPSGIFIIKHEPNIRFGQSVFLRNFFSFLGKVRFVKNSLFRKVSHGVVNDEEHICEKVIKKLESEEGIVFEPKISNNELQSIVDIQSPTAIGSLDNTRGFDPQKMTVEFFPKYTIFSLRTYGYLGKIDDSKSLKRKLLSKSLELFFPSKGYYFDLILKK